MGYENLYEVSDQGRVKSLNRLVTDSNGVLRKFKSHIIKPRKNPARGNYLSVALCSSGCYTYHYIHRLVLQSFIGPCPPNMQCCHNDGNASNNCLNNLRWDTIASNHNDKIKHNSLIGRPSLLSDQQIKEIRQKYKRGNGPQLALIYNTTYKNIHVIVKRKTHKNVF